MKQTRAIHAALLTSVIAFLCSCGSHSGDLPSRLSRFPEDLNHPGLGLSGIDPDGWAGATAAVTLAQPTGDQVLSVRGMVPKINDDGFKTEVELRINGKSLLKQMVGLGEFRIFSPVDAGTGGRQISLSFSATQELPGSDGRHVGARLAFIGFDKQESANDIVRGSRVRLTSGWGALETFHDQTFRWVDNDAGFLIDADRSGDFAVSLEIEPGPGTTGPFLLKVLDMRGQQVGAVRVGQHATVTVFVPVTAGNANEFRFHVDGGGKPARGDSRILNFRVFRINGAPQG